MAGRPPLSDSRKTNRLAVMLTEAERAVIDAAAAKAGKPASTWARDLLLSPCGPEAKGTSSAERKTARKNRA